MSAKLCPRGVQKLKSSRRSSGVFLLKKANFLPMNQAHRSNDNKLQRIDHPQRYKRLEKANAVWVYVGSLTSSRPLRTEQSSHRRSSR
jgi:hypothetical protein